MNVDQIISLIRGKLDDAAQPYLWTDSDLIGYLNQSIEELCERCDIIIDSLTDNVCRFIIVDGTTYIELDETIIKVLRVKSTARTIPLKKWTVGWLDQNMPGWQDRERGDPEGYLLDDTSQYITFVPLPNTTISIILTVSRYPITLPTVANIGASVAIPIKRKYHYKLIPGMLYRAYQKNDSETKNPRKAAEFLAEWENNINNIFIDRTEEQSLDNEESPQRDRYSIYE